MKRSLRFRVLAGIVALAPVTPLLSSVPAGASSPATAAGGAACGSGGVRPSVVFDYRKAPQRSPFDGRPGLIALVSPGIGGELSSVAYPTKAGEVSVDGIGLAPRSAFGVGHTQRSGTQILWRGARGTAGDLYVEVFTTDPALFPQRIVASSVGGNGCPTTPVRTVFVVGPDASTPPVDPTTCEPSSGPALTTSPGGMRFAFAAGETTVAVAERFQTVPVSCESALSAFELDGRDIVTRNDAALLIVDWLSRLHFDGSGVDRELGPGWRPADFDATITAGEDLAKQLAGSEKPPTDDEALALIDWRDRALATDNELRASLLAEAAAKLRASLAEAAKARKALQDAKPILAEQRRTAFRGGAVSELETAARELAAMDKSIAEIGEYIDQAQPILQKLSARSIPGARALIEVSDLAKPFFERFGKFADLIDKLDSIKPILELANTAMPDVDRISVAANAQVTIIGLAAGIGGYGPAVAHMAPVMETINTNLAKVLANLVRKNQELLQFVKNPATSVNWVHFEGGYPMYVYLTTVMKWKLTAAGAPPLLTVNEDYLRAKDDELLVADPFAEKLPEGNEALSRWIVDNRELVWQFFYGSLPVPR